VFVAIGGNGLQGKSSTPQHHYFARFLDRLLCSDFTKDYTLHISGAAQSLFEARAKYIPRLAEDSDFVLMSDADMVVPSSWWRYTKKLFATQPKLGLVVPLMTGNGYFDFFQRVDVQKYVNLSYTETEEGREYTPGTDLHVLGSQGFPDMNEGVWADGFQVIRSQMVRELGRWSGEREFRDECSKRNWLYAVCAGFIIEHAKSGINPLEHF
jgi:hypothetical protein